MKKIFPILLLAVSLATGIDAQVEPGAGIWKTWFITSGKEYRAPQPASYKAEIEQVINAQQHIDPSTWRQVIFWNAGAPGYRWYDMMGKLWMTDTSSRGVLANMLLGTAIYDATIAAWDTKYAYNRPRPYEADKRIKLYAPKTESPAYPCEYSVAAGAAVTIISHFFPALADSANRMAQQLMTSRVVAGTAFPSDTQAGFALGKKIAEQEIARTQDFLTKAVWDGKTPGTPGTWTGKFAMFPTAGLNKTVVLENASQFRPGPPPDYAKEMAEIKNYKQTFRSKANAFYFATQNFGGDMLNQKIFEYNLQSNAPRVARVYAATAVASYDCFVACWDAKYTYWGIRPEQYDTSFHSLIPTPPFPGYPSGHAVMCGMMEELYSYFFPIDRPFFIKTAKAGAESRFQGGIHFRSDNEVGLDLGRKVSAMVVQKIKNDGADTMPRP